jgi:GWxTD domain-containing protein
MRSRFVAAAALCSVLLAGGCASAGLEKRLDPTGRDFVSKTRYLITREERRTFLNLPPSEREAFIAEFWKKRDPDPETEANAFRDEYFRRIDQANRLFSDGGEPGWLQDRGRIYILLGPPSDRATYPRGVTFYGLPMEFWSYGFFPIVFIDRDWTGNYKLEPQSANQLAEIMSAQLDLKPRVKADETALEARIDVRSRTGGAFVRVLVPYKKIWFAAEGGRLKTALKLEIAVEGSSGTKAREARAERSLDFSEEELPALLAEELVLEVELELKPGSYVLVARLENSADGSRIFKTVPFKL